MTTESTASNAMASMSTERVPLPQLLAAPGLFLRPVRTSDAAALAAFTRRNFDRLEPWLPVPPRHAIEDWAPKAIEESARGFTSGRDMRLMIFSTDDDRVIHGHVMLTRIDRDADPAGMLSYAIDRADEGRGIIRLAVQRVLDFAFDELALPSIGARYRPANARSARVLRAFGFREEAMLGRHAWLEETPGDVLVVRRSNRLGFVHPDEVR